MAMIIASDEPICRHCRLPEYDHHDFEALVIPIACKCPLDMWDENATIPEPCECEHDPACHEVPK